MKVNLRDAPFVENRLRVRFTVDVNEQWVLLRCIEIARLQHPCIEEKTITDIKLQELRRLAGNGLHSLADCVIVFEQTDNAMRLYFNQLMHRRNIQS